MKLAIVMPSIGDRPWAASAAKTFTAYAHSCGADFFTETTVPDCFSLPSLPDRGRKNKIAYASKTYFAWEYLHKYDRVLVVDDTCCVRAGAANIFDAVPFGHCGFTTTSTEHAERSFRKIRALISERGLPEIKYDPAQYMNSGVMVYDKTMMNALSPERIIDAAGLLLARHPHQTLSYYLLQSHSIPCHVLSNEFNQLPAMHLPKEKRIAIRNVRPHFDPLVQIHHVTSYYVHRERIVKDLARLCLGQHGRSWGTRPAEILEKLTQSVTAAARRLLPVG